MHTVAIIGILSVILAQRAAALNSQRWLASAFVVIFVFLALRYDFGNDYAGYLAAFQDAESSPQFEPAWQALSLLFQPVGFFALVAALAAFNCWVYYRLIKDRVPHAYYGLAVFLYVFSPNFMLVHSSAMRQCVAIGIFVHSIRYIENRQPVRYAVCALLAIGFHLSAVVIVPAYLLARVKGPISTRTALGVFALYWVAVLSVGALQPYLEQFVGIYAARYEVYESSSELEAGVGAVFGAIMLAMILLAARQQERSGALLFAIAVLGYFTTVPLGMINQMAGRLGMYFTPALIAVIPMVVATMKDRRASALFVAGYACVTLYFFLQFFESDIWRDAFETYSTIFSAPELY